MIGQISSENIRVCEAIADAHQEWVSHPTEENAAVFMLFWNMLSRSQAIGDIKRAHHVYKDAILKIIRHDSNDNGNIMAIVDELEANYETFIGQIPHSQKQPMSELSDIEASLVYARMLELHAAWELNDTPSNALEFKQACKELCTIDSPHWQILAQRQMMSSYVKLMHMVVLERGKSQRARPPGRFQRGSSKGPKYTAKGPI